jgi:GT2 family glycosyltransferase
MLSIIIISFNTRETTLKCLRSVYAHLDGVAVEVIVVDNASADGSADAIAAQFPQVVMIRNPDNAGFGAANNLAMQQAKGENLLLLNSDAFLTPGALPAMLAALHEKPNIGLVGPRLLNADGSLQRSCYRFPSPLVAWLEALWISAVAPAKSIFGDLRTWPHDEPYQPEWVIGACMMVRRQVYETVGGFDPGFFMYAEETDWQKRIRAAGWEIAFTPAAAVTHLGGASGADDKPKINNYFFSSGDYYYRKHHGVLGMYSARAAMTVGALLRLPLWGMMWLALPKRRAKLGAKMRLRLWLIVRHSPPPRTQSIQNLEPGT